jgi:hypothetical protein
MAQQDQITLPQPCNRRATLFSRLLQLRDKPSTKFPPNYISTASLPQHFFACCNTASGEPQKFFLITVLQQASKTIFLLAAVMQQASNNIFLHAAAVQQARHKNFLLVAAVQQPSQ